MIETKRVALLCLKSTQGYAEHPRKIFCRPTHTSGRVPQKPKSPRLRLPTNQNQQNLPGAIDPFRHVRRSAKMLKSSRRKWGLSHRETIDATRVEQ